jgi:aldose 1-epimerase
MKLSKQTFNSPQGDITWFTITNDNGAEVVLSSLGAGVVAIRLPEADGKLTDVVLGYEKADSYFADGPCAGKTPGRYANRIANGHFTLNGKTYTLPINNGPNHLHGGPDGFQNHIWEATVAADNKVTFTLHSAAGDAGYPANLTATVTYTWDNTNQLTIDYNATTDSPTVVNLTNHTYFNLDGHNTGSCLKHTLKLNCSKWLPTDDTLIPSGEIAPVAGTPMDFTTETEIGSRINDDFAALTYGKGYDNCWLIDGYDGTLRQAAQLRGAKSGHTLTVYTNQPAAQVYTGNWLAGSPVGKDGYTYNNYDAVAIECQGCPDAPNHANFPSQLVEPGKPYSRTICFRFS